MGAALTRVRSAREARQGRVLWHRIVRALREPERLRRLHHASLRASLRTLIEPTESRFFSARFGVDAAAWRRLEEDLFGDVEFARAIERRFCAVRGRAIALVGPGGADHEPGHRLLYYFVRLLRPRIVVETGVFDGLSSAFLLKGLRDNGHGRLCSIDLPARRAVPASTDKMPFDTLPPGGEPGWVVPDALRPLWEIRLGDSRDLLAAWLAEIGNIDLFFHDSLHTEDHMAWEFETVWPSLSPGGLLLSDDVFWSRAFGRFAQRAGVPRWVLRGIGGLQKAETNGVVDPAEDAP